MGGCALGIVGIAADDRDWHDTEHQDRSLRFGNWVECHWQNAVVASTCEGGMSLHILVIQLSHSRTTNGPLLEHCNLWSRGEVRQFDF